MAWTDSRVHSQALKAILDRTVAFDFDTDAFLLALFNNSVVPDKDTALTNMIYNAGTVWLTANEVFQAGQWAQGGVSIGSPTVTQGAGFAMWDANDVASGVAATLANVYGCLPYDNTLATKYALCFNYLGGVNSVTGGQLTVVWNANGLARLTN